MRPFAGPRPRRPAHRQRHGVTPAHIAPAESSLVAAAGAPESRGPAVQSVDHPDCESPMVFAALRKTLRCRTPDDWRQPSDSSAETRVYSAKPDGSQPV